MPYFIAVSGFVRSLASLEAAMGIRVNGVAPGVIKTPLWTEHEEKLKMIDESQDVWVTPEYVAEAMYRCISDESIGGGYMMEVLKDQRRNVEWRMDPGPEGPGATVAHRADGDDEALGWLQEEGWGVPKK